MNVIKFSLDNPVKLTVGVFLSVLFGVIAYLATPVQLTPDVVEPEITVSTRWPGASALEVEREIIDEQEEQLKSVEGLDEFTSESSDSQWFHHAQVSRRGPISLTPASESPRS